MLFFRGVGLPPQGSFADEVMTQLVIRERQEKMATWEMLTSAVGAFLGHNADTIKNVLRPLRSALAGEVFQTDYSADKLLGQLRARLEEVRKTKSDIDRLNSYTVTAG